MVKNSFASSFCVQLFPYPYNLSFGFSLAQLPAPILSDYRRFAGVSHLLVFQQKHLLGKTISRVNHSYSEFFFLYRRAKPF